MTTVVVAVGGGQNDVSAVQTARVGFADGEAIAYRLPGRIPDLWVDAQAEGRVFAPTCPDTWRWTRVDVTFERPGDYRLELGCNVRYYPRGTKTATSPLEVREVWLTGDMAADPERSPFVEVDCPERRESPEGFLPARVHATYAAALNTSIRDPLRRPPTSLVECYSWFLDPARCLKYGVTDVLRMDEPIGRDARRATSSRHRPLRWSGFRRSRKTRLRSPSGASGEGPASGSFGFWLRRETSRRQARG